jgi:hypothetical protein
MVALSARPSVEIAEPRPLELYVMFGPPIPPPWEQLECDHKWEFPLRGGWSLGSTAFGDDTIR